MSDVSQECVLIIGLLSVDLITKHLYQPSWFYEWCQSVAWPDWSTWSLFLSCEITWWRSEYPNVVKYLWLLVKRKVCGGLLFWFCQPMVFSYAPVDLQDCKSVALLPVSLWKKKVHFTPYFDKFDSYVVYSEPFVLSSQYKHTSTIFTHSYFICDGKIRGLFNIKKQ